MSTMEDVRQDPRFKTLDGSGLGLGTVTVVVIDTGIDLNHPAFGPDTNSDGRSDRIVFQYDFSGANDGDATATIGHGTHVAGIVGAWGDTVGIAPEINLVVLKVFLDGKDTGASPADINEALSWVVANADAYNIAAVNLSLGGGVYDQIANSNYAVNFNALVNKHVGVVVAAGNDFVTSKPALGIASPSNDPNAISVGNTIGEEGGFNTSSNRSPTILDISAPGTSIKSTWLDDGTATKTGTSMAAPYVSGLIALGHQLWIDLKGDPTGGTPQVARILENWLKQTADTFHDSVTNADYKRANPHAFFDYIYDSLVQTSSSDDNVNGSEGDDRLFMLHGDDVVLLDYGDDFVDGGQDNDYLEGNQGDDRLVGGTGDDFIVGGTGDDYLAPGAGADTIIGGIGFDILDYSGETSDGIQVNLADGFAGGSASGDKFGSPLGGLVVPIDGWGIEGVSGTNTNDVITGSGDYNILQGLGGSDVLDGGGGIDTLNGGAGDDTYIVDDLQDVIVETEGEGRDRVQAKVSFVLPADADIEVMEAFSPTSTVKLDLTGNTLEQTITGNAGENVLGDGGGESSDTLIGLGGNDTYFVRYFLTDLIEVAGGGSADVVRAAVSYGLSATDNIERLTTTSSGGKGAIDLTGNPLKQEIIGNAGANELSDGGKGAADTLSGLGGNDTYRVFNTGDTIVEGTNSGTDDEVIAAVSYALGTGVHVEVLETSSSAGKSAINLYGNEIDQSIIGNAGANRIDGKGGGDYLSGLGGADTFVFGSKLGGGNIDIILDFNPVDDRFLLSDAIFTALTPGTITADQFRANKTGEARDATDRIIYDTDSGGLFYDVDGIRGAAGVQFAAIVSTGLAITNADFEVV